jgi:hypothetical protein
LVLGSADDRYEEVYSAVDELATRRPGHRLKRVLAEFDPLPAQASEVTRNLVANGLIRDLSMLKRSAPDAFAAVRPKLPRDVGPLDPAKLRFPEFRIRAYKREGARAFTAREKRRRARPPQPLEQRS